MLETTFCFKKEASSVSRALTAAAGMCLFALFVHSKYPLKGLSVFGLGMTFLALFTDLRTNRSPAVLIGLGQFTKRVFIFTGCGTGLGSALGLFYRWGYDMKLFPSTLGVFAPVAVLIGATEEVVYRGYIQGRVHRFGPFKAAAFAALCHTAYKCSLFTFHSQPVDINMFLLGACTFVVGLVLGVLRERTGSLLPAVAAHVLFDIMAYGAYAQAPWWVWS
jgi:membrane protease YdiL (CAAX protease family)